MGSRSRMDAHRAHICKHKCIINGVGALHTDLAASAEMEACAKAQPFMQAD